MLLTIKRTFREAWLNFIRNGWLSVAALGVLVFSLYTASLIYTVSHVVENVLSEVQDKVNVSVYFKTTVPEENILKMKEDLGRFSEVKAVEYTSREKALEDFKKSNAEEPVILQSLNELGENPLMASLSIKATQTDQYEAIAKYFSEGPAKDDVSRINYAKNKELISRLDNVVSVIRKVGFSLGLVFAIISVLITFNTIRLTIYTQRKAIEVMRLVGASNTYIRLPFIIEGILYGFIASLISMIILYLSIIFGAAHVSSVIASETLSGFYQSQFIQLFLLQASIGIILGILSSWIAMRKYLKI